MTLKNLKLSILYDFYGNLLDEKQRNAFELYYNEDFSLSEIAEHTGISRQGVRNQIKKAENQLCFYENKLSLIEKQTLLADKLQDALSALNNKDIKKATLLIEKAYELL